MQPVPDFTATGADAMLREVLEMSVKTTINSMVRCLGPVWWGLGLIRLVLTKGNHGGWTSCWNVVNPFLTMADFPITCQSG